MLEYAKAKGEYQSRYDALVGLYAGMDADIEAELAADLVGDYIFTDADFVSRLSAEQPKLFQKMWNEVKYFLKSVTAGSKEAKELLEAKKLFEKAYRENKKPTLPKGEGVKYSIDQSEINNFAFQVDNIDSIPSNEALVVCGTPDVFLDIGLNKLPMILNLEHAKDAVTYNAQHPDRYIGKETLKSLPQALQNPIAIISSKTNNKSSLVAIVDLKGQNGKSIIAPVYLNGLGQANGVFMDVNSISSVHERRNAISRLLTDAITEEANGNIAVFYLDNNKATQLARYEGLQLPNIVTNMNGSIHSITENGSPVKDNFKNILQTETKQFKKWFGKSKAVDKNGKPLVVYHSTNSEFWSFDKTKYNQNEQHGDYVGEGFFFADTQEKAQKYGSKTMPAYLRMENPLVINSEEDAKIYREMFRGMFDGGNEKLREIIGGKYDYYELLKSNPKKIREYLQNNGYDGLIDNIYGQYAVFEPTQIKSATDNIGTFDGKNPDIRYSLSEENASDTSAPGAWNIKGEDVALASIGENVVRTSTKKEVTAPIGENVKRNSADVQEKTGIDAERDELTRIYEKEKARIEGEVADKAEFVKEKAKALYNEIRELKTGVKASKYQRINQVLTFF